MRHLSLTRISFALAYFVVVFGAFVRLSDAGLSCPDWPGCYGNWRVPMGDEAVARANAAFPDTPLQPAKALVEMVHRYAAGLLGLLVLFLAAFSFRARRGRPSRFRAERLVGAVAFISGRIGNADSHAATGARHRRRPPDRRHDHSVFAVAARSR